MTFFDKIQENSQAYWHFGLWRRYFKQKDINPRWKIKEAGRNKEQEKKVVNTLINQNMNIGYI